MLDLTLAIAIIDCFIPESAPVLLGFIAELDDEALAVSITLWAIEAERETTRN